MGLLKRLKVKHYILLAIFSVILAEYFGIFRHLKEKDFDKEFSYPLNGDVTRYVDQLKAGQTPSASPVFKHDYYMYKHPKEKCLQDDLEHYQQLRVIYLVKSAAVNVERRNVIRQTWGFEKRFADVPIRTVFLLGMYAKLNIYLFFIWCRGSGSVTRGFEYGYGSESGPIIK
jgi:beta-1,3-galactosyltransferase / beta-1,3-N-acetylglucosaminyltransferase